jgi:hypothetical protein
MCASSEDTEVPHSETDREHRQHVEKAGLKLGIAEFFYLLEGTS